MEISVEFFTVQLPGYTKICFFVNSHLLVSALLWFENLQQNFFFIITSTISFTLLVDGENKYSNHRGVKLKFLPMDLALCDPTPFPGKARTDGENYINAPYFYLSVSFFFTPLPTFGSASHLIRASFALYWKFMLILGAEGVLVFFFFSLFWRFFGSLQMDRK